MNATLRRFAAADAVPVKNLILSILAKEYPFDQSAYADSDLNAIGTVYGGKNESFFVIDENGAIVGTVGIKEDSTDDALLRRLFVDEHHRKKGYGTQLVAKAIAFCTAQGFKRIYFRCTDRMTDAMKLCEKHGFKKVESLEVAGFRIHRLVCELPVAH